MSKQKNIYSRVDKNRRRGSWTALFAFIVIGLIITFNMPKPVVEVVENPETGEIFWNVIWRGSSASAAENNPGAGVSGWLATFQLNYSETPGTCLASNASGGQYDTWGNVSGYVNTDDTDTDLPSESGNYYVVRCRFNQTVCASGGVFNSSRTRCHLTVSGDETISDVAGTIVESYNTSDADYMYINYYWDDGVNGYRITDDGSMAWNITIYAKY